MRKVCRPLKLYFFNTGFGPIEVELGCWLIPRFGNRASARQAELERMTNAIDRGIDPTINGSVSDPPPAPRPAADTARYLGEDGLHLAALDGRPEVAGWLIARGRDPAAADSFGFAPIHYVGWAQRPLERFVPALEQSYLDVLDTLLAHGADVDLRVGPGIARVPTIPAEAMRGASTLSFAGPECADRLVERLLERGADPNVLDSDGAPAITGAQWMSGDG